VEELVAYVKEHGDHVYIQTPLQVVEPEAETIKAFAFASAVESLKAQAPNPKIMWLAGRYVEADNANQNGDQWTAGELAIKQLTPVLMPITVMHDLRTAVGTIADAKLRLPKDDPEVPRARIETALALWAHRFPDIAEEAKVNASQGTLMQSMECVSPAYDCSTCGQMYQRMPGGAERENWCAHLRGDSSEASGNHRPAARILRQVVFTGTGLIFGTRGARGAYREAHLEVEELAELHAKAHHDTARKRPRRKGFMEIEDARYAELVAAEQKAKTLEADQAAKDKAVEEAEAAKVKADQEREAEKKRADDAEEKARVAALRDERLEGLGSKFTAKLEGATATLARLKTQAGTLSDDEWKARLEELGEAFGVKADEDLTDEEKAERDKDKDGDGAGGESTAKDLFTPQEVTASAAGSGNGSGSGASPATTPSATARQSVVGGLIRRKPEPASAGK
jgi:hypothetical protein